MRTGKQLGGRAVAVAYGLDGDEAAVQAVKRIYDEFTDTRYRSSLAEIAAGLNVDEVRTKRGARWHASSVRNVLRNVAYVEHGVISESVFLAAQWRLQSLRPGPPR